MLIEKVITRIEKFKLKVKEKLGEDRLRSLFLLAAEIVSLFFFFFSLNKPNPNFLESLVLPIPPVFSLLQQKNSQYEIFGFAPYWKINSLDNVDFSTLTTLAYFGVPVNGDGTLDTSDPGYSTFKSDKATDIFSKAHRHGTRVVLTLTQMDNMQIESFLEDPNAQSNAINESVSEVRDRGIDGINVDMEYVGDPGDDYRNKFTTFVSNLREHLHSQIPGSKLTVSVYATSVKDKKLYDIKSLSNVSDGIFMMAYDFAIRSADNAMPTSPLYGHKQGQYWYDVSTAVNDFLTAMPSSKLILGVPWYGYDYQVDRPGVNVSTSKGYFYWYRQWISPWYWVWRKGYSSPDSIVQTYSTSLNDVKIEKSGWDNLGKVGWKAYKDDSGNWRMFFMEDSKSLGVKYDFAKNKNLEGIGIWALGFDEGKPDMWTLLRREFGNKIAINGEFGRIIQ